MGIKAIGSHVFLPQHEEGNFLPHSCSNKNQFSPLQLTLLLLRWVSSPITDNQASALIIWQDLSEGFCTLLIGDFMSIRATYSDSFMSCISTPSIWVDSVFTMHKEIFMQRRHLLEVLSPQLGALFFHAEILASGHKVPLPVSNK